ncbi:MAG: hypothetical protein ACM3ST_17520 [Bdellovibrio bacteriovorus]
MRNGTETASEPTRGQGPEETFRILADELRAARAEARRQGRRLGALTFACGLLLGALAWSVIPSFSLAEATQPRQAFATALSAEERAARRAELVAMLPADRRQQLDAFEREAAWVTGYMQTWEPGQAGAVVALMLFKMAQSMDTMPSMDQQMRAMSGQMGALPAIVAELSAINAKMHVITATMDSTMGRAGRMMPWMPFSP